MTRYGLITDLHFGLKKGNRKVLSWQKQAIDESIKIFKTNKVEKIVILGDSFEDRSSNLNYILDEYSNFVYKLLEDFKQVIILVGNHDMPYTDSMEGNIISTLFREKKDERIIIVTEPIEIDDILFVPWIMKEDVKFLEETKARFLFGHLELQGFKMTMYDQPCNFGLSQSLFRKFEHVLSGHFHLRQNVGNINYLGTMTPLSWNEYGSEHGVHIFENGFLEFYPLETNMFSVLKCQHIESDQLENYRDKIVKLVIPSNTDPNMLDDFIQKVNRVCLSKTLHILDTPVELEEEKIEEMALMEDDELLDVYVETCAPKRFDPKNIKDIFKSLEEAVKNETV